jgi:hypothetical protein
VILCPDLYLLAGIQNVYLENLYGGLPWENFKLDYQNMAEIWHVMNLDKGLHNIFVVF